MRNSAAVYLSVAPRDGIGSQSGVPLYRVVSGDLNG